METVIQKGDVVLRAKSREVGIHELSTPEMKNVLRKMTETLTLCEDGVALAAPQIAESLRIFVVSPRAWKNATPPKGESLVYINPKIVKLSKKREILDEGCLSVRGIFGKTKRAARATVTALDENGKEFTRGAGGLLAQIFQHEIDHLDGVLFIDHATDLVKYEKEKTV